MGNLFADFRYALFATLLAIAIYLLGGPGDDGPDAPAGALSPVAWPGSPPEGWAQDFAESLGSLVTDAGDYISIGNPDHLPDFAFFSILGEGLGFRKDTGAEWVPGNCRPCSLSRDEVLRQGIGE